MLIFTWYFWMETHTKQKQGCVRVTYLNVPHTPDPCFYLYRINQPNIQRPTRSLKYTCAEVQQKGDFVYWILFSQRP